MATHITTHTHDSSNVMLLSYLFIFFQAGSLPSAAPVAHEPSQSTQPLPPVSHQTHPAYTSHLAPASSTTTSQQQELQAKILSLFNSGSGTSVATTPTSAPQTQSYSSSLGQQSTGLTSILTSAVTPSLTPSQPQSLLSSRPVARPSVSRMPGPQSVQRSTGPTGAGINFDNPSVQKALDTLIQSGPALNQLVNSATAVAAAPRAAQGIGQGVVQGMGQTPQSVSHYPRHY